MRNDINFKPLQLPKLNDLLNVEDDVDFKFVYINTDTTDKDGFLYSDTYRIKNNTLLYSDEIPFSESMYSINSLMIDNFIGIKIVK